MSKETANWLIVPALTASVLILLALYKFLHVV